MERKTVGQWFKYFRELNGLTQRDLAELFDCEGAYIAMIESEKFKNPITISQALYAALNDKDKKAFEKAWMNIALEELLSPPRERKSKGKVLKPKTPKPEKPQPTREDAVAPGVAKLIDKIKANKRKKRKISES